MHPEKGQGCDYTATAAMLTFVDKHTHNPRRHLQILPGIVLKLAFCPHST